MRVTIDRVISEARVRPAVGDKPVRSEQAFWYALKRALQRGGWNVIKKEMVKDGHMVSERVYYVRSRNMNAAGAIAIWDDKYAIRDVAKDYRRDKGVDLKLEWERLPKGGKKIECVSGVADNPRRGGARLWVRLGDQGEYEEFGSDLDAVGELLAEAGIKTGRSIRRVYPGYGWRGGIEAPGYEVMNYISLYWGDADANRIRDLSDAELQSVRRAVDAARG